MAIQDKFNRANTIYKVTRDIDLGGGTLTIPEGCTLDFQGGSFANGTLIGTNTNIEAELQKIFNTDITISGTWDLLEAYPEWFGATMNGSTDDTVAIQKTVNMCSKVIFGPKIYKITSPIQLKGNSKIEGAGSSQFAGGVTIIRNSVAGSGAFWYTNDTGVDQKKMPEIRYMRIDADYPIKFNDESTAIIADGSTSNVPYGMQPMVISCMMKPITSNTGIGISWSKMFDGLIEGCEIVGFNIGILLNGSDINTIRDNRIYGSATYHILNRSIGSFGSQNEIVHNDLLTGSSSLIFIKSTDRVCRIYDNYLESVSALEGFIDTSSYDIRMSFPQTSAGNVLNMIIRDNRLDGINNATSFVYRVNSAAMYTEVTDHGTVGPLHKVGALQFMNSSGELLDYLPVHYNTVYGKHFNLSSPLFGIFNGFKSQHKLGVIDRDTLTQISTTFIGNNAYQYLRFSDVIEVTSNSNSSNPWILYFRGIVMKTGAYRIRAKVRNNGSLNNRSFRIIINNRTANITSVSAAISNQGFKEYVMDFRCPSDYERYDDVSFNVILGEDDNGVSVEYIKLEALTPVKGNTSGRPEGLTNQDYGFQYYDVSLNKPFWWTGSAWITYPDSSGSTMAALTFTGAVETTYNGSTPVTVNIPTGGGGTTNYEDLSNKPKIGDVELVGTKTLVQLGIQPAGDYATETYVTEQITAAIGTINTALDNINGEVI